MLDIRIEKTTAPKAKPTDESKLGFGQIFTDHMALIDWNSDEGWHDARIVPFGNLTPCIRRPPACTTAPRSLRG